MRLLLHYTAGYSNRKKKQYNKKATVDANNGQHNSSWININSEQETEVNVIRSVNKQ